MNKVINLGILAHVDAGKTTVTESLLHIAGAVKKAGRVDHGNTVTDSMRLERERGITIRSATVSLLYKDVKINILDTPGHTDFISEVERSLAVLDAAVLVISAREGVQAQTSVLFRALQRLKIPTLFFINKLDRIGADYNGVLAQIQELLTQSVLTRQMILGSGRDVNVATLPLAECRGIVEQLFQTDDDIARLFLSGQEIPPQMLCDSYRQAVAGCRLHPVYAGVALLETGITELMEAIITELPKAEPVGMELSALVYKLEFHERFGRLCYLRLYSGAIVMRKFVSVYGTDASFRVTMLFSPDRGELRPVDYVAAGDIAVLMYNDALKVGAVLGEIPPPIRHTSIAEPLLLTRVCTDDSVPRPKLLEALRQLCLEDPLLGLAKNQQTGSLELKVFGQVQMEILRALAMERYGIAITLEEPQTIFRERPAKAGEGNVPWGETPFQAGMGIILEPLYDGAGILYETKVNFGYLYASFQNAAREGLLSALKYGLCGWEVTDARITLAWATYNSVTSTPADFRNIAMVAVIRAMLSAGTDLFEPILSYTLTVPGDMAGRATYDLNTMHATLEHMDAQCSEITYSGKVSLNASKLYAQTVAAYTKGTGVFTVRLSGYSLYSGCRENAINYGCEMPSEEKYLLQKAGRIV